MFPDDEACHGIAHFEGAVPPVCERRSCVTWSAGRCWKPRLRAPPSSAASHPRSVLSGPSATGRRTVSSTLSSCCRWSSSARSMIRLQVVATHAFSLAAYRAASKVGPSEVDQRGAAQLLTAHTIVYPVGIISCANLEVSGRCTCALRAAASVPPRPSPHSAPGRL